MFLFPELWLEARRLDDGGCGGWWWRFSAWQRLSSSCSYRHSRRRSHTSRTLRRRPPARHGLPLLPSSQRLLRRRSGRSRGGAEPRDYRGLAVIAAQEIYTWDTRIVVVLGGVLATSRPVDALAGRIESSNCARPRVRSNRRYCRDVHNLGRAGGLSHRHGGVCRLRQRVGQGARLSSTLARTSRLYGEGQCS